MPSPPRPPATRAPGQNAIRATANCAALERNLPALAKAARPGQTSVACVDRVPHDKVVAAAAARGVQLNALPKPDFCYEHTYDGWWYDRWSSCRTADWKLVVRNVLTLAVTGELYYTEIGYETTIYNRLFFTQALELSAYWGWGNVAGTTVDGGGSCRGICSVTNTDFPNQPFGMFDTATGEIEFTATIPLFGSETIIQSIVGYTFYNSGWIAPSTTVNVEPPLVACDSLLTDASPGCVVQAFLPVMIYELSGPYPELARHIRDAQSSGLRGDPQPLLRTTDPTLMERNRNKACPSSLPPIPNKSCDEYPFASTYDGAYLSPGTARTFNWCSITLSAPPSTGDTGWSRCMINAEHNSLGGAQLSVFYRLNRVRDMGPFKVHIR